MNSGLVPMHLGELHAYETVLLGLLAFGPFVVLAVVVVLLRRRDASEPDPDQALSQNQEPGQDALPGQQAAAAGGSPDRQS